MDTHFNRLARPELEGRWRLYGSNSEARLQRLALVRIIQAIMFNAMNTHFENIIVRPNIFEWATRNAQQFDNFYKMNSEVVAILRERQYERTKCRNGLSRTNGMRTRCENRFPHWSTSNTTHTQQSHVAISSDENACVDVAQSRRVRCAD